MTVTSNVVGDGFAVIELVRVCNLWAASRCHILQEIRVGIAIRGVIYDNSDAVALHCSIRQPHLTAVPSCVTHLHRAELQPAITVTSKCRNLVDLNLLD